MKYALNGKMKFLIERYYCILEFILNDIGEDGKPLAMSHKFSNRRQTGRKHTTISIVFKFFQDTIHLIIILLRVGAGLIEFRKDQASRGNERHL